MASNAESQSALPDWLNPSSGQAIDLNGHHLHFVGIGGSGMAGLAAMAHERGATVTGSDRGDSEAVASLRQRGIDVALEQTAKAVPGSAEVLVASAAIPPDHPECEEANRRGVHVLKYAQLLGLLMQGRVGVAVAGTHGKSTTTSLLSHTLIQAGLDPSLIVGARCEQIGGGSRVGQSDLLVAEACEYDRSFHHLHPTHGVVLNLEADHLDMYASLAEIVASFHRFAALLPKAGSLLIQHESPHRLDVTAGLTCAVETIGFAPQADWRVEVESLQTQSGDRPRITRLHHGDQPVAEWLSPMPGEHMDYNAACAAVTAHRLGADWPAIEKAIAGFKGLDRRMQRLGTFPATGGEVLVIDDYGHHPTEVDATLRALRRHYRPDRLICVFQPHQHSRTRFLMDQFTVSFGEADIVIVPEIYFVRDSEQERQAITAEDLVKRLRVKGVVAMHVSPMDAIPDHLRAVVRGGDLVVTMGAGDVWKVATGMLEQQG